MISSYLTSSSFNDLHSGSLGAHSWVTWATKLACYGLVYKGFTPCRDSDFFSVTTASRRTLGSTQSTPWVPETVSSGIKCRGLEYIQLYPRFPCASRSLRWKGRFLKGMPHSWVKDILWVTYILCTYMQKYVFHEKMGWFVRFFLLV
jgi:hypothetical protein